MRWRAVYADGSTVGDLDRPAAYATLDRSRLVRFEAWVDDHAPAPDIAFDVPLGRRLVRRERVTQVQNGPQKRVLLVGTESEDRSDVDVWLLEQAGPYLMREHLTSYGTDAATCPPVLWDFEGVRA